VQGEIDDIVSLVPLDEALADRQQRRAAHRRIFRDMVKGELETCALSWWRRRDLVKFAASLGIDRYEALLLIRGVEYEEAMIPPAAMPSTQASGTDDLGGETRSAAVHPLIVILVLAVLNSLILRMMGVVPF
jgi:hypothetical protein